MIAWAWGLWYNSIFVIISCFTILGAWILVTWLNWETIWMKSWAWCYWQHWASFSCWPTIHHYGNDQSRQKRQLFRWRERLCCWYWCSNTNNKSQQHHLWQISDPEKINQGSFRNLSLEDWNSTQTSEISVSHPLVSARVNRPGDISQNGEKEFWSFPPKY